MAIEIKLPTDKVTLPSNGFGYEGKNIPKQVTLKMLTLADSKTMMAAGNGLSKLITGVLERCVVEKFDVTQLYTSDRLFLFMMLRKHSFGSVLKVDFTCDECKGKNTIDVNIPEDLDLRLKEEDSFEQTITLDKSGVDVTIKLLTGEDEARLERKTNRDKSSLLTNNISAHVVKITQGVEEEIDSIVIDRLVNTLAFSDKQAISDALDNMEFGFKTTSMEQCAHCNNEQEVGVAFGHNFFRV